METEINAYVLTSMINKNPLWWHYETITMEDFLARRPTDKTKERRVYYQQRRRFTGRGR